MTNVVRIAAAKPVSTTPPSEEQLLSIPESQYQEFQISEKQARSTRGRIYSLNKNNARWKFRTMYESGILRVFKFERW